MIFTKFTNTGWKVHKMFEKNEVFFNKYFKASDLRLPKVRVEKPKPKPKKPNVTVTIFKRDDKPDVENDLDKVLENLIKNGQPEKAYLIQQVYENSTDFAVDLIHKLNGTDKSNVMTPIDGTALLLRLNLSKNQYQVLKNESDARKSHFLPSYKLVQKEKEECLPDGIDVTEDCAQVPLEELMIKTFQRHMEEKSFKKMIYQLTRKNNGKRVKLHMYYKSGYDCASGQSRFKVSRNTVHFDCIHIVVVHVEHFTLFIILPEQLVNHFFETFLFHVGWQFFVINSSKGT